MAKSVEHENILSSLPHPVLVVGEDNQVAYSNEAAQHFFQYSGNSFAKLGIGDVLPFGSPVIALVSEVREREASINEYKVDISTPRLQGDRVVDVYGSPTNEHGTQNVILMFHQRAMAERIDRQLTHRSAARSVTGLAAMLAHEIKNPLSGIRGAAQLLEQSVDEDDRALTRLITDEADRIVKLVDRMEVFSDERPVAREPLNIHVILDRVKKIAKAGFAKDIRIVETYDPSLPPISANQDQLIQVFLNLVKNAAEAVSGVSDPEITLQTAFRPGVRLSVPGSNEKVSLPLEFSVIDNGPGISDDIAAQMFDPFVTTKTNGTGLGLALVAKIIGSHGGVIECDSQPRRTAFHIRLPKYSEDKKTKSNQIPEALA